MDALGMFLLLHCSSIWAKFMFISGLGPPSAEEGKSKVNYSCHWKETTNSFLWASCSIISPLTAILIIIVNFMNILLLASSLGPLMFFTFDHLLCPAREAELSCSALTWQLLHGGHHTPEGGERTDSAGAGNLPEVVDRVPGRRVRRALNTTAAPAMPFTHTHTPTQNSVTVTCCTCGAKTVFKSRAAGLRQQVRPSTILNNYFLTDT